MTKSDLRNGMVVRTRSSGYYLFLENCKNNYDSHYGVFINCVYQGWLSLADYNDNLLVELSNSYDGLHCYDIVAVYQPHANILSAFLSNDDKSEFNLGKPIWVRVSEQIDEDLASLF